MAEVLAARPAVTYLNHGTVGVTPRRVLAAQQAIRDEIERRAQPLPAAELSAASSGCRDGPRRASRQRPTPSRVRRRAADDLVFVDNTTTGANAVLRSFPLEPGDEILVTDSATAASRVRRVRRARAGATVRTVAMPYPRSIAGRPGRRGRGRDHARTRIAVVDHITSESALVLPLAGDRRRCRARGVAVLVDGAHAPGALPLDIPSLGVDWYIANLHKWACAPRSCGFLWAPPARQAGLHPPVISWGLD